MDRFFKQEIFQLRGAKVPILLERAWYMVQNFLSFLQVPIEVRKESIRFSASNKCLKEKEKENGKENHVEGPV